jgi:hypothetical protein
MSVSERRLADRRHETRTEPAPTEADHPPATMRTNPAEEAPVRDNPEVMGRTEPRETQAMEPQSRTDTMTMWPDMTDFQRRFEEIQSDFIEDPKAAVQKAERLMEEAIDRLAKSMREHMQSMHRDNGGSADTEQLRLTMRTYREFIQSLDNSRAA